jgi:hypothetical protein
MNILLLQSEIIFACPEITFMNIEAMWRGCVDDTMMRCPFPEAVCSFDYLRKQKLKSTKLTVTSFVVFRALKHLQTLNYRVMILLSFLQSSL